MKRLPLILLVILVVFWSFWKIYISTTNQKRYQVIMLPAIKADIQDLLKDLEAELEINQPGVTIYLKPGITDLVLTQWEAELGGPIHPEMQALYRWHNGMERGFELFPGYEFYSLEDAVQTNRELTQEYRARGMGWLMSEEDSWLILFPDPAGDGFYYDFQKVYESGAVFFNFRETSYFMYFPSIKNLLASVIDCYRKGVYRGTETTDFDKEMDIMRSYGQEAGF